MRSSTHLPQADAAPPERFAAILAAIRRRFGPHSIRVGSEWASCLHGTVHRPLHTGSLGLDLLLGGLPRGKISEYAGSGSGSSEALGLAALATCQRSGGLGLLVDPETSLDPDVLTALGVEPRSLILVCPRTAAEAWVILPALVRSGCPDFILVASLPGLFALPRDERGRDGFTVRRLDDRLSRLAAAARGRRTALLLLNDIAPDAGPSDPAADSVGEPLLARHAALRVLFSADRLSYTPDGAIAHLYTRATVIKHHGRPIGPPIPLTIDATGPRRSYECVELGLLLGCVERTELGPLYRGRLLGRSLDRAAAALEVDGALAEAIAAEIAGRWAGSIAMASAYDQNTDVAVPPRERRHPAGNGGRQDAGAPRGPSETTPGRRRGA
jgi:recombination protein RecA